MVPNSKEHRIPVIYLITNKVNGKIYVGSAKDFWRRYLGSYCKIEKPWWKPRRGVEFAIKRYGFAQFNFEILEYVSNIADLPSREQHYLDTLLPFNRRGYNMCRTAYSTLGRKVSKKTRKLISCKNYGKNTKSVLKIDSNTLKILSEYPSITVAAKELKVGPTSISNVCRGKKLTSGGFVWCFKDKYDPSTFQPRHKKIRGGPNGQAAKPVIQFDQNGNQIRIWDHAVAAATALNVHPDCIRGACYGRIKVAHGYRWEFVTDKDIITQVNMRRKQEWSLQHGTKIG